MQDFGKADSTQYYIKVYNSTHTQAILLIKYGDNIKLWDTLKNFNNSNSIDIIYEDDAWGKCTAKQIYDNICNQLFDIQKKYENDIYDKDLHQLNKKWLIKINELGKKQEQALLGLRFRFEKTLIKLNNKKQRSVFYYFIKSLYDIDINTDEGLQEILNKRAQVESYIECCCDQYGRLSPFSVAFFGTGNYNISERFNQLVMEMNQEQAEAEAEGFQGKLTVFKNINVEDELDYIVNAVSDANTLLSSIGIKPLEKLSSIKAKVRRYLKTEDAKFCHGLSYVRTPKTFIDTWSNMAKNERNKKRENGAEGITIQDIMDTYINFMQAAIGQAVQNKYSNGIKRSVYKYPPQWQMKQQNETDDSSPRRKLEDKLYDNIVKEKLFEDENE